MAHQHARYTTFRAGELETTLRELGADPGAISVGTTGRGNGKGRLLKAHSCPAQFVDGTDDVCHYERQGPAWHLFRFERQTAQGQDTLPRQYWSRPLGNDAASIEAKAKELALAAFDEAIRREQREYFMRASEGAGRKKHPAPFSMTADKARRLAGRYALCRTLGQTLVPVGETFASLLEANAAWLARGDFGLVVGGCNRLDRCWQRPHYQPLHADPRYGNPYNAVPAESTTQGIATRCSEKGE